MNFSFKRWPIRFSKAKETPITIALDGYLNKSVGRKRIFILPSYFVHDLTVSGTLELDIKKKLPYVEVWVGTKTSPARKL
eukprot:758742-Hanusia_phi.AAC.1